MTKRILTQDELKSKLNYNPDTGIFTRKNNKTCGYISPKKYILITVSKKVYMAHRLAWLYCYGNFPIDQIDHMNGNRLDNRIANLRDVPQTINQQNQKNAHVNNSVGYLGVTKVNNKFISQIRINNKKVYLGIFDTPEIAHDIYMKAKVNNHTGFIK